MSRRENIFLAAGFRVRGRGEIRGRESGSARRGEAVNSYFQRPMPVSSRIERREGAREAVFTV